MPSIAEIRPVLDGFKKVCKHCPLLYNSIIGWGVNLYKKIFFFKVFFCLNNFLNLLRDISMWVKNSFFQICLCQISIFEYKSPPMTGNYMDGLPNFKESGWNFKLLGNFLYIIFIMALLCHCKH